MKKNIPKYSQYIDVNLTNWKSHACGIVSLRMITDYYNYKYKKVAIDKTIKQGLVLHAYIPGIGWAYKGLIRTAKLYGCKGIFFDWKDIKTEDAYKKMIKYLIDGPIMVSIPKDFNEKNSSHLVVLESIKNDKVTLLDPATTNRDNVICSVTLEKFLLHWKKRILIIRPNIASPKK
ncbi:hypothetical protein C4565_01175 [Candidatus Parcubacteria bacterium]|jgi:ABC-type bacteriocin/lantibiotic exporter with double-glycine peptidase domain|nr:MAG: hypothetical protein C4565_01175 [Candidatus Parcubacteria bacterium]